MQGKPVCSQVPTTNPSLTLFLDGGLRPSSRQASASWVTHSVFGKEDRSEGGSVGVDGPDPEHGAKCASQAGHEM